ncbi:hypothetical protein LZ31DRAFT_539868 [Colletotrichum somersetense]|nr:hypothetical protein LZ31DRAFT_539868 [Colletotrichum somersetense]
MKNILGTGPVAIQMGIFRFNQSRKYVSWNPKTTPKGERFRSFYSRNRVVGYGGYGEHGSYNEGSFAGIQLGLDRETLRKELEYTIAYGVLDYAYQDDDNKPVHIAARSGNLPDLAEFYLKQGIDNIRYTDHDAVNLTFNANLLWIAFWETANFKEALLILVRHGVDIDHDMGRGHTLLVEVCLYGNYDEALALIDAGADVTVVLESLAHNPVAVRILLDSGVNPTSLDEVEFDVLLFRASKFNDWIGASSRHYREPESQLNDRIAAALRNYSETFSLLLERLRGCRGEENTASTVAMSGFDQLKRFNGDAIMRHILDDNLGNSDVGSAQNTAASQLVTLGFADINNRDRFDRTLLKIAAAGKDNSLVPTLLRHGAKIKRNLERDNLVTIWVDFVMIDDYRNFKLGVACRLICTLDVEKRIPNDPWFFAIPMYGGNHIMSWQHRLIEPTLNDLECANRILTGGYVWNKLLRKVDASVGMERDPLMPPSNILPDDGSSLVQVAF